ncbi:MAG TPA: chemotaxis protein CheW [Steroidobacteraceae bacterium]|jgi:purine-binding chemotaxis protein CheW
MNAVATTAGLSRDGATAQRAQYLTFMLGGEAFAIGILAIKEILEYDIPTSVPMMPGCIRGVINLRGAVVPVMDLSLRFGTPVSEVTKRTCVVIVEALRNGEAEDMGVVVDAVNAVVEIDVTEIEPSPSFGASIRADFIHGLGKVDGKFIMLLNTDRVLDIGAGAGSLF